MERLQPVRAFFNKLLVILLNDYKSDVVSLRRALSKFIDGFQQSLLHRLTSSGRLLLKDLQ